MASVERASGQDARGWMDRLSGGDPLFGNKVLGGLLAPLMFVVGINIFSEVIFTPKRPAVSGYELPSPEPEAAAGGGDQQAQAEPLPVLLASADSTKGQGGAKKCLACHIFDKGGPNKIGPNLWGVVGRKKGSHEGFAYSGAMKGKGGEWSYDDLNQFLANPKAYVPGTIMAFAGVSNPKERADILAFLKTQGDSQVPFPAAEPAAAGGPPAGGPAAGGGAGDKPAAPPGPSQSQQQPSPPIPGQRAEPGPAPQPATPQPAGSGQAPSSPPAPAGQRTPGNNQNPTDRAPSAAGAEGKPAQ